MKATIRRCVLLVYLIAISTVAFSQNPADRYLGYKWSPLLLSSFSKGTAPEVKANMEAFETLVKAEQEERQGRYLQDIINGFWYYTTSHTWSCPEETGGKLPPYEGQKPSPTSLKTARMLNSAWINLSDKISAEIPALEACLAGTMKRITGQQLNNTK